MNDFKKRYRQVGTSKKQHRKLFRSELAIEGTSSDSFPRIRLSEALSAIDRMRAAVIARWVGADGTMPSYRSPIPMRAEVKKIYREIAEIHRNGDSRENRKKLKDALARLRQFEGIPSDVDGARRSAEALDRARDRLLKPGVSLGTASNVPRFHADPDMPSRLVRILGGKKEVGYFVDGEFKPAQ